MSCEWAKTNYIIYITGVYPVYHWVISNIQSRKLEVHEKDINKGGKVPLLRPRVCRKMIQIPNLGGIA